MKATYSQLITSRFYNPAFNSAIFDGPLRIYFAQFHESLALKIYFGLQQKSLDLLERAKEKFRRDHSNALVMIYPSTEAFELSFEGGQGLLLEDQLSSDLVIGINGPFDDDRLNEVLLAISEGIERWISALPQDEVFLEAQP